MIHTDLTKKAIKLCFEAHKDQKDKTDLPYIFHPFHLAEQMKDEYSTATALLHDVVEDTDYTLEDLKNEGFPKEVVNAVALLTHEEGIAYMDYIAKVKTNPIASAVKLADLAHNSDLTRYDTIDKWALKRTEKYKAAIAFLQK